MTRKIDKNEEVFTGFNHCPDIVSRWDRLNKMCGGEWGGATKFKLFAFRLLRIQAGGSLFKGLKKIYIWATSL